MIREIEPMENFVSALRAEFYQRLEEKTGWGKEQLKLTFEQAMIAALCRYSPAVERKSL